MKTKPELIINEIQDIYLRRNFSQLDQYFKDQNQLLDFKFFEVKFTEKTLIQKVNHGMRFIPRDIVFLGATNNATVSFNIGLFTNQIMDITANKETTLRFFVGKYFNDLTSNQPAKDDVVVYGPDIIEPVASTSTSTSTGITTSNMGDAGQVVQFAGINYPTKTLVCDGTSYAAPLYPKLAFALWDSTTSKYAFGGTGVYPNGTFNVPDMRGNFPRGVTGAAATDPNAATRTASGTGGNTGNNVGSVQTDAMQGHRHSASTTHGFIAGGWAVTGGAVASWAPLTIGDPTTDGVNGTPRTAAESRPKNLYFNYIIKTE